MTPPSSTRNIFSRMKATKASRLLSVADKNKRIEIPNGISYCNENENGRLHIMKRISYKENKENYSQNVCLVK